VWVGTTVRTNPSLLVTRTVWPLASGCVERARQSSLCTRTQPSPSAPSTTVPWLPIICSRPVTTGRRRAFIAAVAIPSRNSRLVIANVAIRETGTPKPDAWFPAYAPVGDAEIAVATVLVHVKLATGGTDAAPLVRRVMSRYFFP